MPRPLVLLGALLLLALAGWWILGTGEDAGDAQLAPDAPLPYETPGSADEAGPGAGRATPTLQADEAARARALAEEARRRAEAPGDAGPTGPYAVSVIRWETEMPLEGVALLEDVPLDEARPDAEPEPFGVTGEEGTWEAEDLGVPSIAFRALKEGYVEHRGVLRPGETPEVVLFAGVPVTGRVLHAVGRKPVPHAQLTVWDVDLDAQVVATTTDEEGRFRLRAVRPHRPLHVVVTVEGLVPHLETSIFEGPTEEHEIVVGAGGRITGVVRDEHGRPRPKTEVRLQRAGALLREQRVPVEPTGLVPGSAHAPGEVEDAREARTWTDDEGRFAFDAVPLGRAVTVVAVATSRRTARSREIRLQETRTQEAVELQLPRPGTLRILVRGGGDRTLGHAQLAILLDGGFVAPLAGDRWEEGAFVLEGLGPGRVVVRATIPGRPGAGATDRLPEGGTLTLELSLEPGGVIEGEVRDKRGEGIWQALVTWRGLSPRERVGVRTDLRGRFRLHGLKAEHGNLHVDAFALPHTLTAYESRTLEDVRVGDGRPVVVLADGTTITGRFADLPARAVVTVERVGGVPQEAGPLTLDAQARFRWRGPPAERGASTWVFRTHGLPPLVVTEEAPFRSEEVRDLGLLAFEDANPRRGMVVDETGRPVHAAKVALMEVWSHRATRTDTKGHFGFARVPDEPLDLRIDAPGHPPVTCTLDPRSQYTRQVVRLRAGRWITLRALQDGKQPVAAQLRVRERDSPAAGEVRAVGLDGWLTSRDGEPVRLFVPLGVYEVLASGRGVAGVARIEVEAKGEGAFGIPVRRRR